MIKGGKKMKQTTIVAIILGVLVVLSAVQAVQLNGLKSKLSEGKLSVSSSSSKTSSLASSGGSSQRTAALPSNIKDLPQMVGGC